MCGANHFEITVEFGCGGAQPPRVDAPARRDLIAPWQDPAGEPGLRRSLSDITRPAEDTLRLPLAAATREGTPVPRRNRVPQSVPSRASVSTLSATRRLPSLRPSAMVASGIARPPPSLVTSRTKELVDLYRIERQAPKIAQGRIASTEVVDREPHAEFRELAQAAIDGRQSRIEEYQASKLLTRL